MKERPNILVVGSINIDLVTASTEFPLEGETIVGEEFNTFFGGKGANQAVAASRLGAEVSMIGCVGKDDYGKKVKAYLKSENINVDSISEISESSTGIAHINTAKGENKIIIVPGANYKINKDMIDNNLKAILEADIILLQLEIPISIVEYVCKIASKYKIPVILNPAPAKKLPATILKKISYITPNETELAYLCGDNKINSENIQSSISKLHQDGVGNVIVTQGKKGVFYSEAGIFFQENSIKVDVVDTTGAGDAFNGALAVGIAKGNNLTYSIKFANVAAALSITKNGAQEGLPKNIEIEKYFADKAKT